MSRDELEAIECSQELLPVVVVHFGVVALSRQHDGSLLVSALVPVLIVRVAAAAKTN